MHTKAERIMAIIGIILLVALYGVSIILGITGNKNTFPMFIASFVATVFIPTIIYVYRLVFKVTRRDKDEDKKQDE